MNHFFLNADNILIAFTDIEAKEVLDNIESKAEILFFLQGIKVTREQAVELIIKDDNEISPAIHQVLNNACMPAWDTVSSGLKYFSYDARDTNRPKIYSTNLVRRLVTTLPEYVKGGFGHPYIDNKYANAQARNEDLLLNKLRYYKTLLIIKVDENFRNEYLNLQREK